MSEFDEEYGALHTEADALIQGWSNLTDGVAELLARIAAAWDEGHRASRLLGPDGCQCEAWNESECGCGLYGTNIVTPNPYRAAPSP